MRSKPSRIMRLLPTIRGMAIRRTYSSKTPSLAMLDDYLDTSSSHFAKIPPSQLRITTSNDTIVPSNEVEQARLVEGLQPFDLISTVRKRTAFPGSLLQQLPDLRLLLATITQLEMFDLASARRLGIKLVAAPGLGRTDQAGPVRPNVKKDSVQPTTQHAWALILVLVRNLAADDALLKAGAGWQSGLATGLRLTLGIVGLGRALRQR